MAFVPQMKFTLPIEDVKFPDRKPWTPGDVETDWHPFMRWIEFSANADGKSPYFEIKILQAEIKTRVVCDVIEDFKRDIKLWNTFAHPDYGTPEALLTIGVAKLMFNGVFLTDAVSNLYWFEYKRNAEMQEAIGKWFPEYKKWIQDVLKLP